MCILGIEHKPEMVTSEAWNKADLKAMNSIELHLSDEVTYNVTNEKTANDTREKTWEVLHGEDIF